MLELAALGLLQQEPLHGYRLKQQLELFMSGCISVNYGAIYPLLRRLEQRGDIAANLIEGDNGNLSRKVYQITDQGRALWREKMRETPQESWVHARSRFMIKYFFFSHLTPQEQVKLLEQRLMVCQLRLTEQEIPEWLDDPYQKSAWSRCQTMIEDEITWLKKQLSDLTPYTLYASSKPTIL